MWSTQLWFLLLFSSAVFRPATCNPVSPNFNDNLREFSVKQDDSNTTVTTLQKEELGRYANFAPVRNPIRFKEIPDNALSSSSYRALAHHDHGGYAYHEYEESPHYGYSYDYDHHGGLDHFIPHHGHHLGPGHGHHHKHHDHALVTKAILWPLAGLAILGTAAALVTNPVLLQLGVISGRRRRDLKDVMISGYDFQKWKTEVVDTDKDGMSPMKRIQDVKEIQIIKADNPSLKSNIGSVKSSIRRLLDVKGMQTKKGNPITSTIISDTVNTPNYNKYYGEDRFVPIPLKVKNT